MNAVASVTSLERQIEALKGDLGSANERLAAAERLAVEGLAAFSPMIICTDHGLCNRLRAVLSYRQVAQAEGRELIVVWRSDAQCNGYFLDCFAPLVHLEPSTLPIEPTTLSVTLADGLAAAVRTLDYRPSSSTSLASL